MINNKYALKIDKSYYIFDLVNSFSITNSSQLTEFPLINKQLIYDHRINDPIKISISGTIGTLNPGNNFKSVKLENDENLIQLNKLEYIKETYKFFKKLKDENIFVNVWTPTNNINNCLVTDFTWNDMGTHVEWSMNLSEVKTYAFINEDIKIVDKDPNLPDLNDLAPQSFIDGVILQDKTELLTIIGKALNEKDLLTTEFAEFWTHVGKSLLFGVVSFVGLAITFGVVAIAIAIKAVAAAVAAGTIAASAAVGAGISAAGALLSNPIGWGILLAAAVVAAIGYFIYAMVKWAKKIQRRRTFIHEFEAFKTDKENQDEIKRYNKTMEKIFKYLQQIDNVIESYKIKSNTPQELNISIDGQNFILKFMRQKNNATWKWSINKYDEEKEKNTSQLLYANKSAYELDDSKAIFKYNYKKVYFVWDFGYDGSSTELKPEERNDLTKLNILVTEMDMEKFKEKIGQITIEAMKLKQG